MLFNSLTFAVFLPLVFLLYWFVFGRNVRLQNMFVVLVSYIFYGWWDWRFLLLIAFTSACSYASGLLIQRFSGNRSRTRLVAALNICINLLILGVFKYYDFFVGSFADLFLGGNKEGLLLNLILPVGISFYTFQALSYSIDVYRGTLPATHDPVQFFAYVSFFPQLVAGPIERAGNLLPQFAKERKFSCEDATDGLRQMLWGFFKKIVVADNCALYVNAVFADYNSQNASTLAVAVILFALQIYGDFSGYSDIAIGTSKLFGIRLMQNFRFPYFSRNIAEFWRRWHISLTTWFRDYIYIPLGGSRVSKWKIVRNTFVIYLVSGLWHGANWTFVAWGAFNALLFLPSILSGRNRRFTGPVAENRILPSLKELLQMLATFLLVCLGWVFFRSESIAGAGEYLARMCSLSLFSAPSAMGLGKVPMMALTASLPILLVVEWSHRNREHGLQPICSIPRWLRWTFYYILLAIVLLLHADSQSFIYFQF